MSLPASTTIESLPLAPSLTGTESVPLGTSPTRRTTLNLLKEWMGAVMPTRKVTGSGLLSGGGTLEADRTIGIAPIATDKRLIGRNNPADETATLIATPMLSVITAADAPAARTAMGLGSAAVAASGDFARAQRVIAHVGNDDIDISTDTPVVHRFTGVTDSVVYALLRNGDYYRVCIGTMGAGCSVVVCDNDPGSPIFTFDTANAWADFHKSTTSGWVVTARGSL